MLNPIGIGFYAFGITLNINPFHWLKWNFDEKYPDLFTQYTLGPFVLTIWGCKHAK